MSMLLHDQNGHFSHAWEHQLSSSLDDDDDLSSLSSCSSAGSLGFRGRLGFLGRSLALTPSARSLLHSPTHSSTASLCLFTISFHSSCSAAFAAFRSSRVTRLCSSSSASFSFLSFWSLTKPMDSSLVKCRPYPSA